MLLFEVVKHSHGLEITRVDGNQSSVKTFNGSCFILRMNVQCLYRLDYPCHDMLQCCYPALVHVNNEKCSLELEQYYHIVKEAESERICVSRAFILGSSAL